MGKPILEIKNISKEFAIGRNSSPYLSFRDNLNGMFQTSGRTEKFMALNDVSFDVNEGDTLGIIGKNGAGKSTLLKILSRITPPSAGKIISRGRIASLLEVGTGFHAELTGRENVFMNGSILGMRRKEINRNFDAIVDFAGIQKFIDTPLKHYSSGMQLRLAFAVAAFLENEILIIDEVLAVGDAEFQKKCLGKMDDVSKSGRTVLFVSHNMHALKQLCSRSVMLEKGQLKMDGDTASVIDFYHKSGEDDSIYKNEFNAGENLALNVNAEINEETEIKLQLTCKEADIISSLALFISTYDGFRVGVIDCRTENFPLFIKPGQAVEITAQIAKLPLIEGDYYIGVYIESNHFRGNIENAGRFHKKEKGSADGRIEFPKQYRGLVEFDYVLNLKSL